ncbi:multifunctional CCA addition/repair protein [Algiphilus sp.]|uniref:multifunctional CCA addition/repair protein n=1 Tax=Algiphilus sp. TaxID=1872431 RepID=UPI0025BC2AF5|nr:multifunctional CCA addition/repair protein [Algiphilus sp.]MCK5770560.1 multifunctional CCA addition/repair protein [Algiphilus sp.]
MQRYLVGGAVRDRLLGLPVRERDWVVVGASQAEMEAAGYRAVGRDFPVFLHPETGEEHALARTERKSGRGYRGFVVDASPDVTLEADLTRRDLTVNAIAEDADGTLIDPCGGQADLAARVLRHVSPAFVEDPLRVLRVARFATRFAPLGFRIADETMALMREIVARGEMAALAPERVWRETERALMHDRPSVYIATLRESGALAALMPEVDRLFGVPQRADYHPEIDTGVHLGMALDAAAAAGAALPVRVAVLLHDLGKAETPSDVLPRHPGHEHAGEPLVRALCERLRVPATQRDLALAVCRRHIEVHRARELRPATLLRLVEALRGLRDGDFFEHALAACAADARGRLGHDDDPYPSVDYLRAARERVLGVQARDVIAPGMQGPEIGGQLRAARERALAALRDSAGS